MNTMHIVVVYSVQLFVCTVGIVGFLKYKQLINPLKFLEWYVICSLANDILIDIMVYNKIRTLWVWQCFAVFELFIFIKIFNSWYSSRRYTSLIWAAYYFYLIFWIVGKFSFEPFTSSDVYSETVSQVIQIGFGSWILLSLLQDSKINWKTDPRLWVVSGIVLYAITTFFIFGMFEVLWVSSHHIVRVLWMINNVFILIQYIFFLRAFLCNPANTGITNISQTTHKE